MRVLILGNNDGPLRLLRSLGPNNISIAGVCLQKPVSGDLLQFYKDFARNADFIHGYKSEDELISGIRNWNVDLVINCFSNIIFKKLLHQFKVLNIHLSLLPKYRGRHPLHWALINGEKQIGLSIHEMTAEIDGGEILFQESIDIDEGISLAEARNQLLEILEKNFRLFLTNYIEGKINPILNIPEEGFYIPRRYPKDSLITEWADKNIIYRKVKALRTEDYPAFIMSDGKKIEIRIAERPESDSGETGKVLRLLEDGIEVGCENGSIILKGFSPEDYSLTKNQDLI